MKAKYQSVANKGIGFFADYKFCRRLLNLTPTNPYYEIRGI